MTSKQLHLDFTPGLTEQYRTFKDVLVAAAQNSGVKQGTIANACDVSPSEFSKSLHGAEGRRLDVAWVESIITETRDLRPVFYLIEKYLESPEAKEQRVIAELNELLPRLQSGLAALNKSKG